MLHCESRERIGRFRGRNARQFVRQRRFIGERRHRRQQSGGQCAGEPTRRTKHAHLNSVVLPGRRVGAGGQQPLAVGLILYHAGASAGVTRALCARYGCNARHPASASKSSGFRSWNLQLPVDRRQISEFLGPTGGLWCSITRRNCSRTPIPFPVADGADVQYASKWLWVVLSLVLTADAEAGNWPRFRGPNGTGVSLDAEPTPTHWSPTENLKWKTPLPGEGVSCPIVVGDRVFVTTYSGYGFEPGELADLKRHLVCLDRATGAILWDESIDAVLPEDPYSGMGVPSHGYASHTPVSDGERVYVFFGKSGVLAFDLEGRRLWQHAVGSDSDPRGWGSASSPIVVDGLVVVTAGPESRAILGLDAATGNELWSAPADSLGNVWGTPSVADLPDGELEIVIGAPYEIWGLNPKTGKVRWYCEATGEDSFNTSVVVHNDVVYAVEGRGGASIAVKAGGRGDVTKSQVLWTGREANRFGTPLYVNDRLYFVANGAVTCLNGTTGEKVFQARLPAGGGSGADNGGQERGRGRFGGRGGSDYSSPVAAGDTIYYVMSNGTAHVFQAADAFESIAVNQVTTDNEVFSATPAISSGELFLRSNKHLYCISTAQ
ncbi:MAG: PQQ-binding-like beta-propeller repeat protein [Planctomycetaceae bacterium]|nr:PQQ-binding-like beta-propeller repeat protein [Planctomycetaceae bacterium]